MEHTAHNGKHSGGQRKTHTTVGPVSGLRHTPQTRYLCQRLHRTQVRKVAGSRGATNTPNRYSTSP
jgi:hypothetical protein